MPVSKIYQDIPITTLRRTTTKTFSQLQSLGIENFWDLLNHLPTRHMDYGLPQSIAALQDDTLATIQGEITYAEMKYVRANLKILRVLVTDQSGEVTISWFNQVFLKNQLQVGQQIAVAGVIKRFGSKITLEPREYEIIHNGSLIHVGRIVPTYPQVRGLSSRTIREKIWQVLQLNLLIPENLPEKILKKHNLLDLQKAYQQVHFPNSTTELEKAKRRLAFNEIYLLQLANLLIRREWAQDKLTQALRLTPVHMQALQKLQNSLPFSLTAAQKHCLSEIVQDMESTRPMNRFLQGDVGSGKTIVAALAAYFVHLNGKRTLIMAPTEVLAQQHYQSLQRVFANTSVQIALQTGSHKVNTTTTPDIVVGTHALITKKFELENVALVVIDEQHRFGVRQRAELKEKGIEPHLLTMTATPIPRTISLVKYGELDLSVIDELPQGRQTIKTYLTPKHKRNDAYRWIKQQLENDGAQAYIVCPFVEESDIETMQSVRAATKEYEKLQDIFAPLPVGLLHGKMKAADKQQVMSDFKQNKYAILVTTSVVEVGIDVPNATVIVIEGAERFGLAQLHQLRGRVGRSDKQSHCLLFVSDDKPQDQARLTFFAKHHRGIELAEYDLQQRGAGEVYGTRQHGTREFLVADPGDIELIKSAQQAAQDALELGYFDKHPTLQTQVEKIKNLKISRD